ncbi:MAG TPA: CDP-paratose 2-epimerase, partial [Anaerolineae bacterium]|nr:CDP-paratose 2-epimerase [Anaerolineae bacterium]
KIAQVAGQIFNIGGGVNNTLTIWTETGPLLERLLGRTIPVKWSDWRPGDQRICVMDIRKAQTVLGWSPQTSVQDGVAKLYQWVVANRHLFEA